MIDLFIIVMLSKCTSNFILLPSKRDVLISGWVPYKVRRKNVGTVK